MILIYFKAIAKKIPFARTLWYKFNQINYSINHSSMAELNSKNRDGYVVQIVNTLTKKDAIGNCVLELKSKLDKMKINNCVLYFGSYIEINNCYPLKVFKFNSKDTLVYHLGGGSEMSVIYKKIKANKKIIIYHNITPSKFYFDSKIMMNILEKGRSQLISLDQDTDLAICVSKYNESELKELNYRNTKVLGIPTRVPELLKLKTNNNSKDDLILITVGRIARNKCIQDVINAFNEIHKINNNAKLYIVGGYDNLKYYNELKELISKYKIVSYVTFIHGASEKKLAELYSNASGYICMSEHEGFCVPLVEAMAFNVPIFAYASSAIPETLGGAGILFNQKTDFKLIAKTIMDTLNDKEKVKELIKKEQERYKDFDNEKILNNYVKAILGE